MSKKVFNLIEEDTEFEITGSYTDTLIEYSLRGAISDLEHYWRRNDLAEKLVNDESFRFLWSNYDSLRSGLLDLVITSSENDNPRHTHGVSKEFSKEFIEELYSKVSVNNDLDDNKLRARLAGHVDESFDYLAQVCEYSIDPNHETLYLIWKKAGMRKSKDSSFYDYLYSKVKREVGSTDTKIEIVRAAFQNSALSNSIVAKIAKSSPKSLKRAVVDMLSDSLSRSKRSLDRCDGALKEYYQEIVDKTESRVMLFVSCDDSEVVSNLIDCLSKDNLPWLMPSASKHPWLSRRLQQKIDYLS